MFTLRGRKNKVKYKENAKLTFAFFTHQELYSDRLVKLQFPSFSADLPRFVAAWGV